MTKKILPPNITEKSTNKKPQRFFVLLFVVIVLCLLFQLNLNRNGICLQWAGDAPSYKQAATNISQGNFYHHKRLPAYPLFLMLTQWGGDNLTLVVQNILNFACPVMIYLVIFHLTRSLLVSALLAVASFMYYDNTIYTNYALTEVFTRFFVTLWATVIIMSKKPKLVWLLLPPIVLCATKSQFWYVFLVLYFFAAITKIVSWRNCLITILCFSVIPLYYVYRASISENSLVHNINSVNILSMKQVLRQDHRWRLNVYPKGDVEVDMIKKLIANSPNITYEKAGFYWFRGYFEKFIKDEGISREKAFEIFRSTQIKVFFFSILCRPDIHLINLCSIMSISLDNAGIPQNETMFRKFRRWVRYSIEYGMGGLFILSFFASVFLLINGLRGKFEGLSSKLVLLLPLFLLLYVFLLHYIEGQGGRHKIPVHEVMMFVALMWLIYGVGWVKDKWEKVEMKMRK